MSKAAIETCCVVDSLCVAPAGYGTTSGFAEGTTPARAVCVCCDQHVCRMCSSKRRFQGKLARLCNNCQITQLDGGKSTVVLRRQRRLAAR